MSVLTTHDYVDDWLGISSADGDLLTGVPEEVVFKRNNIKITYLQQHKRQLPYWPNENKRK